MGALLHSNGQRTLVDTAKLLVSEAVTNVHRHAANTPTVHIEVLVQDATAVIVVADNDPQGNPRPHRAANNDETGRGLFLVNELAHAWGVTWTGGVRPTGKRVWFEVR